MSRLADARWSIGRRRPGDRGGGFGTTAAPPWNSFRPPNAGQPTARRGWILRLRAPPRPPSKTAEAPRGSLPRPADTRNQWQQHSNFLFSTGRRTSGTHQPTSRSRSDRRERSRVSSSLDLSLTHNNKTTTPPIEHTTLLRVGPPFPEPSLQRLAFLALDPVFRPPASAMFPRASSIVGNLDRPCSGEWGPFPVAHCECCPRLPASCRPGPASSRWAAVPA